VLAVAAASREAVEEVKAIFQMPGLH